jgi:ferredoxin
VSLQCSLLARSRIVPWSTAMRILVVASGAGAADHAPRRMRWIVASGSQRTTRILPRRAPCANRPIFRAFRANAPARRSRYHRPHSGGEPCRADPTSKLRASTRAIRDVEDRAMAHVITEPCIGTKDTACVEVCPVDCIHPTKKEGEYGAQQQLYIDPDTCIDCGLCVDECPVQAIFPQDDVPAEWRKYIQINIDYFKK